MNSIESGTRNLARRSLHRWSNSAAVSAVWVQDHVRFDRFVPDSIRNADHRGFEHPGAVIEDGLHLCGRNILACPFDHVPVSAPSAPSASTMRSDAHGKGRPMLWGRRSS